MAAAKTKSKAAEPVKEIQLLGPPPNGVVDPKVVQLMADAPLDGEVGQQVVEQPVERFKAEQFVPIEKFGPPKGVYPEDAELFSYTPKVGETIWFPMEFKQPTALQVWEQYDLPIHVQTWEWMKWADMPKSMQRRAVELLDNDPVEYMEMFNQWMRATGRGGPAGGGLPGK